MGITGSGNYFDGFQVGDVFEHVRGRTLTNMDHYLITHMSMNTAQAHFNIDSSRTMLGGAFAERLFLGPGTSAIVVGLTSEDMSENAFMDLGFTAIKLLGFRTYTSRVHTSPMFMQPPWQRSLPQSVPPAHVPVGIVRHPVPERDMRNILTTGVCVTSQRMPRGATWNSSFGARVLLAG